MKRRITKAEYDALTPEMKLLYVAEGADAFILPLTDYVDPGPIERARDRERDAATQLRTDLATANTELTTLRASTPKDVQTLTRAHNETLTTQKDGYEARLTLIRGQHEQTLIAQAAKDVAASITSTPENANVMLPHTTARFAVEWNGDVATVKIKKADGTVGDALSEASTKVLAKEFVDNPVFGSIVVKSKASGGGAAGSTEGKPGGAGEPATKKLSEMTPEQKTALYRDNRPEFDRLSAEAKAEQRKNKLKPHTLLTRAV